MLALYLHFMRSIYLKSCADFSAECLPGRQSRVMHQNVQIRAKGHFLPQFVKHNSNNNNEVWFYKERGRLDMLVWFPAQEKRAKARAHRMDSGQMKGLSECWGSLIGSPWSENHVHWPSRLIVQSCGKVIVKHNIEFLQNKETIGRKHNNLCIKTTSFPGATRASGEAAWSLETVNEPGDDNTRLGWLSPRPRDPVWSDPRWLRRPSRHLRSLPGLRLAALVITKSLTNSFTLTQSSRHNWRGEEASRPSQSGEFSTVSSQ